MAYVARPPGEDDEQAVSPLLAGFGAAPPTPGPTGPGGAPAPTAQPQAGSSGGGGGGFVPYSAYAKANEGGAKRMASEVAGRVGGDADRVQAGQAASQREFSGQVEAGSPYGTPAPTGVLQRLDSWRQAAPTQQQAPAGNRPTWSTHQAPPTQVGQVGGYTDIGLGYTQEGGGAPVYTGGPSPEVARENARAKYTGPTSIETLESWRKLGPETQAAQDALAQTADPYGIQALVGRQYGSGGGGGRLDAALTAGAGGSDFDALRAKYGDLVGARKDAGAAMDRTAADAAATTAAQAGRWGDAVKEYEAAEQWKRDHPVPVAPPPSTEPLPGTRAPLPGEPDLRGPESHVTAGGGRGSGVPTTVGEDVMGGGVTAVAGAAGGPVAAAATQAAIQLAKADREAKRREAEQINEEERRRRRSKGAR